MTTKSRIDDIYNKMEDFILSCGIQEECISRIKGSESEGSIVIRCHDLLTIIMNYDREWTIDYISRKIRTHNHIFDIKDDFINDLFRGNIFFLVNSSFFHRISVFSDLRFVSKSKVDKILNKHKHKRKYQLFSVKVILINN